MGVWWCGYTAIGLRKTDGIRTLTWQNLQGDFVLCKNVRSCKLSGPKAQPLIQRRAQPWYIGRIACYVLQCLAVLGPTGQEFA